MKLKTAFISNSSSCTIIIQLKDISDEHLCKIVNHIDYSDEQGWSDLYYDKWDEWRVDIRDNDIVLHTSMDNFSMVDFLERIGYTGPMEIE